MDYGSSANVPRPLQPARVTQSYGGPERQRYDLLCLLEFVVATADENQTSLSLPSCSPIGR
jgi:hypothetical protein